MSHKITIGRNIQQYRPQLKAFTESHQAAKGNSGIELIDEEEVQVEIGNGVVETVPEGDWVLEGLNGDLFRCSDGFITGLVLPNLVDIEIEYI